MTFKLIFLFSLLAVLTRAMVDSNRFDNRLRRDNFRVKEPVPKARGLLKRVKRFGCWHSCLSHPKPYVKQSSCEEGGSCRCLLDLLGHVHFMACDIKGRSPIGSETPRSVNIGNITLLERKLQCNYKTCWPADEDPNQIGKKQLVERIANIVSGIYSGGKCNCGQEKIVGPTDVRPAALNHVHQRENYKFALNYQTFPDEDGQCVCRFGKSIEGEGHHTEEDYSVEAEGVSHQEMNNLENDELRHVFQCGIRGCRHIVRKIRKNDDGSNSPSNSTRKPWYMMELERKPVMPEHKHDTATTVICNLKTCWRIDDQGDKVITKEDSANTHASDPARNSIQLTLKQKQTLMRQRDQTLGSKNHGPTVHCTHGVCSWIRKSGQRKRKSKKKPSTKTGISGDDIVPGKDGLCPCYKAYVTYFNWRHK
ncbi:unnamed protein product [Allacma fusca]|uniref:Uncharacterized protein n=1 Tax=Allacma fusca TaxID=39272 RepID=A0A8J2P7G7_9HEXA|nr:unnamed protein product [Allacma fusca]